MQASLIGVDSATAATAPTTALWGQQTALALKNFPGRGRLLADVPELVSAYVAVKAAAAAANAELGVLDVDVAEAIADAAAMVGSGAHRDQFPTALVQGGGGTSTNMNVNEVLATLAGQLLTKRGNGVEIHPNDHVNRSQSTNDTYPTAMSLAIMELAVPTTDSLRVLESSLLRQAAEHDQLVRLGRTCLQDAVPLTVGETHRAQARAVARGRSDLEKAVADLSEVPLGATAVGTSIGAPPGFALQAVAHLNRLAGTTCSVSGDFFDSLSHLDPYAAVAHAISRTGITIEKIARDLRLLSSGPTGGLGEVRLPTRQAGSSIMPGKVNPVIPELAIQLSQRIRGCAHTVELAVASGELELNVMEPVILDALVTMLGDLNDAARYLADKCIDGMTWDEGRVRRNLGGSLEGSVELATERGYSVAVRTAAESQVPAVTVPLLSSSPPRQEL